jgi:hypothetical protein
MHDGAPSYFRLTVWEFLSNMYLPDEQVEEDLLHAPALAWFKSNQLFSVGTLKRLVYTFPVNYVAILYQWAGNNCQTILNIPESCECVQQSWAVLKLMQDIATEFPLWVPMQNNESVMPHQNSFGKKKGL